MVFACGRVLGPDLGFESLVLGRKSLVLALNVWSLVLALRLESLTTSLG